LVRRLLYCVLEDDRIRLTGDDYQLAMLIAKLRPEDTTDFLTHGSEVSVTEEKRLIMRFLVLYVIDETSHCSRFTLLFRSRTAETPL